MEPFQKTNKPAFVNFLRAKYEMYTGEIKPAALPYYLCIDPSDKCQLRCPTCPTGMENEARRTRQPEAVIFRRDRRVLSTEIVEAVLGELAESLFLVMFYNYGEPLLNPNVANFIRKAKQHRIETELHTNLSLPLSDQRIDDLLTSGLDRLLASIDGFTQETYQIHRVGGDLKLVKSNLERVVKARNRLGLKTHISWGFLVFAFNEHEIPAVQSYCGELGIEFHRREAFVDRPEWLPSYRKRETPWIVPKEALLRKEASSGWSPLPQVDKSRSASACGWHYGYSVVTGGGRVAPCCAVAKDEYDFGQLDPGQVTFTEVWNNAAFRTSRAAFAGKEANAAAVETICTRCPYPAALQHLYSLHDSRVITQFQRKFAGSDAVLEEAFDLFTWARYGCSIGALCRNGAASAADCVFVGHESPPDVEEFVCFFESRLLPAAKASAAQPR